MDLLQIAVTRQNQNILSDQWTKINELSDKVLNFNRYSFCTLLNEICNHNYNYHFRSLYLLYPLDKAVGNISPSLTCLHPIPWTCEYFPLHGIGDWRLQMDLSLLIIWNQNKEIILDYPGGLNIIIRIP